MIRTLAALALLTASAQTIAATSTPDKAAPNAATPNAGAKADPALSPISEWWEKVTVTLAGDGKSNSCRYETSLVPDASKDCDVSGDPKALGADAPQSKDQFTRLTFERRFNPGIDGAPGRRAADRRHAARPPGPVAGDRRLGQGQRVPGDRQIGRHDP